MQRSRRLSDPWAQRLLAIGVIVHGIAAVIIAIMIWNGGVATGAIGEYEALHEEFWDRMSHESERLEAAREALKLCRKVDTEEACQ